MSEVVHTPLLPFVTYTVPKKPYAPPMYAFVTYTVPKKPYAPPLEVFVTYADNVKPDPDPTPTPTPDPDPFPDIPEGEEMKVVTRENLKKFYNGIKNFFAIKSNVDTQFQSVSTKLNGKVDLTASKHIKLPDGTEIWVE